MESRSILSKSKTFPTTKDDILQLAGKLNALSRFISRLTDHCSPFFKALKLSKTRSIKWTPECEAAFQGIKEYLVLVPKLSKHVDGETLYPYLAVSSTPVSATLIRQEDAKELPVYYLAKGLANAETRYAPLEKFALALVIVAQRLRPYFQSHSIHILPDSTLKQVFQLPEFSGRLSKWAIEFSEFNISFVPRMAVKSQAVADFIAYGSRRANGHSSGIGDYNSTSGSPTQFNGNVDSTRVRSIIFSAINTTVSVVTPCWWVSLLKCKWRWDPLKRTWGTQSWICSLLRILGNKQHGWIWSVDRWLASSHRLWSKLSRYLKWFTTCGQSSSWPFPSQGSTKAIPWLCTKFASMVQGIFDSANSRAENTKADSLARLTSCQLHDCPDNTRIETLSSLSITRTLQEIFSIGWEPCWMDPIIQYKLCGKESLPIDLLIRPHNIPCAMANCIEKELSSLNLSVWLLLKDDKFWIKCIQAHVEITSAFARSHKKYSERDTFGHHFGQIPGKLLSIVINARFLQKSITRRQFHYPSL